MQVEEGKQYVTRRGEVVGPMVPVTFGRWRGWDGGSYIYETNGTHGDEADADNGMIPNIPENDIVAAVVPAPGSAGQNGAHTPGPYEVCIRTCIGGPAPVICSTSTGKQLASLAFNPNAENDAFLFASAPQMLEALREALPTFEERAAYFGIESGPLIAIRAAIAAATGEAV